MSRGQHSGTCGVGSTGVLQQASFLAGLFGTEVATDLSGLLKEEPGGQKQDCAGTM